MKFNFNGNSKKSGVYKLVNNKNGRVYIGSCKEFKERWKDHRRHLFKGTHSNKFLQADFNKCGVDVFEFFILDVIEGERENRLFVEQIYLDYYFDFTNQCYNFNRKATSPAGTFPKGSIKRKIQRSKELKSRWADPIKKQEMIFKLKERYKDPEFKERHSNSIKKLYENPEYIKKRNNSLRNTIVGRKYYKFISSIGEIFEGYNITKFAREHGLLGSCMHELAEGTAICYKGWYNGLLYSEHPYTMRVIDPNGIIHTFIDNKKFAEKHNLNPAQLAKLVNKICKNHKGWKPCTVPPKYAIGIY